MAQEPSNPEDIKTRKVELVLQQLDSLPTLPAVVVRLLALTNSSESRTQEVVQLLSADPSLTSKLLSLAGSAASGIRMPVTSVQQAVVMLGFEAVRNLALSVKVFEAFSQNPHEDVKSPFDREEFWKHSLAVATAAELLAAKTSNGNGHTKLNTGDAFVCGLLHDIGKVAFDTVMPKSFARVAEMAALTRGDIADMERRIIGLDHALAGKRLAEAWNLPQVITQAIWLHGAPPLKSNAGQSPAGVVSIGMIQLIGLADTLVRRQHVGFSGNYLFPYDIEQYAVPLGLSAADIDAVTTQLADALETRARAIGLYDVESRQLYLESIANANAELGRMNQQLQAQNRTLSARSHCFELLTKFYQQIGPAASPAQLLAVIGQVAHGMMESSRLVLFSQDPDQHANAAGVLGLGAGEVLKFDSSQSTHESFIMPMPVHGGDQRVGRANQNFTRPASPQVDWLLERSRDFLGTTKCWFMPLLCGNQPVGGIVWAALEGEHGPNSLGGIPDMLLVSQSWGMTLRAAQIREQQTVLTESLAAEKRELGALQQQQTREKSLKILGEMAAGAAHEMNNPLTVISGKAQLLAGRMTDPAMKQEFSLIAQQCDRLSQIITDMMEFAKPLTPRLGPLDMKVVAEEAVKAAAERAGATGSVKVRVEAAINVPAGRGDARQIRNSLTEVILNAMQATRAAAEDPARRSNPPGDVLVQISYNALDQQVIVQVHDRGIGMSQETIKNAFAPFFSAKSAGRNRGMGLAKALRWIENHGGTIRLDSSLGAGTTAVVILPAQIAVETPAPELPVHA